MTKITNTTAAMQTQKGRDGLLMEAMVTGSAETFITGQERAGQHELVHSDRLPSECPREDMEALGFTFGDPDPRDDLFIPATLPEGWTREGSDHAMWSHLKDEHGRRRASIFYKAAFYDRRAFMHLVTLESYATRAVDDGEALVFDGTWATLEAVRAALTDAAASERERVAEFRQYGMDDSADGREKQADGYEAALAELSEA